MKSFGMLVGILVTLALGACSTTSVKPVALLAGYSDALLYYGSPEQRRDERSVPVRALTDVMARATWTSEDYISKGGFWIRYPDGREFFFAVGFDFFRERNVPGTFVVRPEDVPSYRAVIEAMGR